MPHPGTLNGNADDLANLSYISVLLKQLWVPTYISCR